MTPGDIAWPPESTARMPRGDMPNVMRMVMRMPKVMSAIKPSCGPAGSLLGMLRRLT